MAGPDKSFSASRGGIYAKGAEASNVTLPPPSIVPGSPIQAIGLALPADGVAVIIATHTDPGVSKAPIASPPLSIDAFSYGSALAGSPTLALIWFGGNGRT